MQRLVYTVETDEDTEVCESCNQEYDSRQRLGKEGVSVGYFYPDA